MISFLEVENIFQHESFRSSIEILEKDLFSKWKTSSSLEDREEIYKTYMGLQAVISNLNKIASKAAIDKFNSTKKEVNND